MKNSPFITYTENGVRVRLVKGFPELSHEYVKKGFFPPEKNGIYQVEPGSITVICDMGIFGILVACKRPDS